MWCAVHWKKLFWNSWWNRWMRLIQAVLIRWRIVDWIVVMFLYSIFHHCFTVNAQSEAISVMQTPHMYMWNQLALDQARKQACWDVCVWPLGSITWVLSGRVKLHLSCHIRQLEPMVCSLPGSLQEKVALHWVSMECELFLEWTDYNCWPTGFLGFCRLLFKSAGL